MSSVDRSEFEELDGNLAIRDKILNSLTDADLSKSLGGNTMTLGALFREFGEHEHIYAESFRGEEHLRLIQEEARVIVTDTLGV